MAFTYEMVLETIQQEEVIRDSPSQAGLIMQVHTVTTAAGATGTLYTKLDIVKGVNIGLWGGTKQASLPALDIANISAPDATTGLRTITLYGDASMKYTVTIWGYYEGA